MMPKLLAVTSPVIRRTLLEGEETEWRKKRQKRVMLIKSLYAFNTEDNSNLVYSDFGYRNEYSALLLFLSCLSYLEFLSFENKSAVI